MSLSNLTKTTQKSKKRIGRGHGSGKGGHTVGRGTKGQKAREKIPLFFEGTKFKKSLLKRLPLWRGKGKFKSFKPSPLIVNVKYLNLFSEGEVVNVETLAAKGIIKKEDGKKLGVKILGEGKLSFPLTVQLPASKGARRKIEAAGGKLEGAKEVEKTQKAKKELKNEAASYEKS